MQNWHNIEKKSRCVTTNRIGFLSSPAMFHFCGGLFRFPVRNFQPFLARVADSSAGRPAGNRPFSAYNKQRALCVYCATYICMQTLNATLNQP